MLQKIMTKEFVEKFIALNNQKVNVYIKHILYGSQKIRKCILHPFMDGERIGFTIDDDKEKKYITLTELTEALYDNMEFCIKSRVVEIIIQPE